MAAFSFTLVFSRLLESFRNYHRLIVYTALGIVLTIFLFDYTQIIRMAGPLDKEKYEEKVVSKLSDEGCTCWWPVWADKAALENRTLVSTNGRHVDLLKWEATDRAFRVGEGETMAVRVATFYYPFWKARVNDRAVEVGRDENGVISIPLPADESLVTLRFEEPHYYQVLRWSSTFTWVLVIAGFAWFRRDREYEKR
jgi:hypothetical protein